MKKIMLFLFLGILIHVNAQLQPVLKNRRGIAILPQRGDYCLGFSANPFLEYFGNMFNNSNTNTAPKALSSSQMVFAKYMKTSQVAYRAAFSFAINNQTTTTMVRDMSPGAPINSQVSDLLKQRNTRLGLSIGIEKRRGETRLQGYYGAEFALNYNSGNNVKMEYGNKLENFDTGTIRTVSQKGSSNFMIGIRGFAGIEYFIAPRISLGGEIVYGPMFTFNGAVVSTTEQFDFNNGQVVEEKRDLSPKNKSFTLDTNNAGGFLKLLFYF
jgi:hypothetical protein